MTKLISLALPLTLVACGGEDGFGFDNENANDNNSNGNGSGSGCIELTNDLINGGQTLAAGGCYDVPARVLLSDGTLTIEPGVEVRFAQDTYLEVDGTGALRAEGTASQPIRFTGSQPLRGHWRGISIETVSVDNVLDHVVMQYGGSSQWTGSSNSVSMLRVEGRASVSNTTLRESAGWAFQAFRDSELGAFANVTFDSNAVPAFVAPDRVGELASTLTFTNNDASYVQVTFANSEAVTNAATWPTLDVPYRISDRTFVRAAMVLSPGVEIEFAQGASLRMESSGGGSLSAVGAMSAPIVLRGVEDVVGYWQGVLIDTNSASNAFDYVTLANAGSAQWTGASNSVTGLRVLGRISITNSSFERNGAYALQAYADADLSGFSNNTFVDNDAPMWLATDVVSDLAGTSTFTGNTEQSIRVAFGNNQSVDTAGTWKAFQVPYRITDRTFVDAALDVEAGTEIEFVQSASLRVRPTGSISFNGTMTEPILLTGVEKVSGYWQGLEFRSTSSSNLLSWTTVEYAGSDQWTGASDSAGSIHLVENGQVALTDSTFSNSDGFGVVISDGAITDCTNTAFSMLGDADVNNKTGTPGNDTCTP